MSTQGEFKVGDKVRMNPTSKFYGFTVTNPKNNLGRVYRIESKNNFSIRVKWSNGKCNAYNAEDLQLIESVKK